MGEVNETKVLTQEKSITLTEKDKRNAGAHVITIDFIV